MCDAHGPSLPGGGGPAKVTAVLGDPGEGEPPSPAAKLNTGESETALLSRRASPTRARAPENKQAGPRRANI